MTAHFTVAKNALLPSGENARQMLADHKIGDDVEVDVLDPGDGYLRRKIFWIVGKLAKWHGVPRDEMRTQMLISLGRYRIVSLLSGRRVMVVHSMDRRAMQGP